MSSAQLSEQDPHAVVTASEPRRTMPTPDEPQGSGVRKWLIMGLVLLAVGAAVWKIRDNKQQQDEQTRKMASMGDRPTPVLVSAVQQKTMPIYLSALGTVTAYYTVTIKSRVDGQLNRVNVREGQAVHKGDLLLEIDPAPYRAAVAQAEGQLVKDEANLANADAEAKRYTALLAAGVVSKETQQLQVSTAGQAQGAIDADKAAIEAAKVNLAYTRITSPIDGVVGLRQVDPGNIVHAADTTGLLVVTQLQPIAVIFTLPEDQLQQVLTLTRGGKKLGVEAYDRSETMHLASGSLLTVDNQIDSTTGMVKAKAVFDNKDGALFPNQFVNVRLVLQDRPGAIVIPAAALQTGTQGSFVYVVKPGQAPGASQGGADKSVAGAGATDQKSAPYYAEARPVKVELTEGAQVILSSGLEAGEQVVVDGQEKLRNGAKVIPRTGLPAVGRGAAASNGAGPNGAGASGAVAGDGRVGSGKQGPTR